MLIFESHGDPFEQRRRELKKMNFPGNVSVTQAAHDWLLLIERCVYISTAFSSLKRLLEARCGPCEVLSQKSHIPSALEFSRCIGYITIFRFGALSKHSFIISSHFIIIFSSSVSAAILLLKPFAISESHLLRIWSFNERLLRPKKITSQKRMAQDWLDHILTASARVRLYNISKMHAFTMF